MNIIIEIIGGFVQVMLYALFVLVIIFFIGFMIPFLTNRAYRKRVIEALMSSD